MAGVKKYGSVFFEAIIPKAIQKEVKTDTNLLSMLTFFNPFLILFLIFLIIARTKNIYMVMLKIITIIASDIFNSVINISIEMQKYKIELPTKVIDIYNSIKNSSFLGKMYKIKEIKL